MPMMKLPSLLSAVILIIHYASVAVASEDPITIQVVANDNSKLNVKVVSNTDTPYEITDLSDAAILEIWDGDRGYRVRSVSNLERTSGGGFSPNTRISLIQNKPNHANLNLYEFSSKEREVAELWNKLLRKADAKQVSLKIRVWVPVYKTNSNKEKLICSKIFSYGIGQ